MKKAPKNLRYLTEYKEPPIDWKTDKIISYSQFSTWKQCPLKWKLQNVDKLKSPPSIELSFGKAMHTALQSYLKTMYGQSVAAADREDILAQFELALKEEYKKDVEKNGGKHFSNPAEMLEYFEDGTAILEYFLKKRASYFSARATYLVGVEFPLSVSPHEGYPNVKLKGYIDLLLYNENTDKLYIYDFKSSKTSWYEDKKKDKTVAAQILFYKEYFSKMFNWDVEKIEVEFFILKRKIKEDAEFPIPRIQRFSPASGVHARSVATSALREFIEDCFTPEGKVQNKEFKEQPNKFCNWCNFHNTSRCSAT